MTTWERRFLHISNLLVVGTGLVYTWMRFFAQPTDEWAVVNHPWQPHVQHLHVLAAPLLVFACGLIWQRHIAGKLKSGNGQRLRSGPGLLAALVPMIASGYLIQTTVTEEWRQIWIVTHLATSGLWLLTFSAHLLVPQRWRKRTGGSRPVQNPAYVREDDPNDRTRNRTDRPIPGDM